MGLTFDKDSAQKTDSRNFITESGIYKGIITSAVEKTYSSGSQSISFDVKTDDGKTARFMNIFTMKKDGTPAFGFNQIQALMGILQIREAKTVCHDNGDDSYDCFCRRPIAFALQRINTPGKKYKFKMNILHFFDYSSLQTYKEKTNGLEAKVYKAEIEDGIDESGNYNSGSTGYTAPPHNDDDLPF